MFGNHGYKKQFRNSKRTFTASSLASGEQDAFRLDLHITLCKKMGQNIALWLILLLRNKTIGKPHLYRRIYH